ncbi:MAG: hypothetical protein E3K37_02055 [Candidatus Kuenenia sp.]|nr:hypothetical protein [Candidatus Kuenenia hertensis]
MNVERFVYSRTLSADYRWIITSSSLTSQETQFMERFLDLFKKYRFAYTKAPLKPLFCIHFPKTTVLFTLQSGMFKDEFGRDIYSLEGICAGRVHRKALWRKMPEIIGNYTAILNAWNDINFQKADNLVNKPSTSYTLEDLISGRETPQIENKEILPESSDPSDTIILPFVEEGLKKLKKTVNSPSFSPSNFAFGCTAEMVKEKQFRIIAYVDDKNRKEPQTKTTERGRKKSFISDTSDSALQITVENPQKVTEKKRFFTDEKWKKIVNKIRLIFLKK